jgi:4-carboxymuconolactone decarboxylase
MTPATAVELTLATLDDATRWLIRAAAAVAGADETVVRAALASAAHVTPTIWIEEMLLQSYLFAGFPRALNAMREWRKVSGFPPAEAPAVDPARVREAGEATCGAVYDGMYGRLRENIRALHPLLDDWMISEGYGKVLSRPGLDLRRRELCIVAACVASGQDRQLHSHLHGALNVGVDAEVVSASIDALGDIVGAERVTSARMLLARVSGK